MVAHTCEPRIWATAAGELRGQGQRETQSEILPQTDGELTDFTLDSTNG